jgi:hypothetical protein
MAITRLIACKVKFFSPLTISFSSLMKEDWLSSFYDTRIQCSTMILLDILLSTKFFTTFYFSLFLIRQVIFLFEDDLGSFELLESTFSSF